jgi:hypothetical protein
MIGTTEPSQPAPGQVAMVTMPDIDTGQQGTGVVDVIALNADANHDGTMDFTYQGPDQTSSTRPFRFWVNDDQDVGDDGGNFGVPGLMAPAADGYNFSEIDYDLNPVYRIHGTRDLVDFFPVYLNIGSLFQSNALSANISATDTNYQFVLSQADGVLRFAYTDLTPTNYMNFLQDTNEARTLGGWPGETGDIYGGAQLTTISNLDTGGIVLPPSFLSGIATSNQGIILVEAAAPTTQPLVLTIYHGTNQIAQTQLPLSISGVEQMFRSKTILLTPLNGSVPDRLTDASVTNEPDTIDANFVFLHGYNVLPQEARGVDSDVFKRMYWAGSHAKFWAVTWEGADTKIGSLLTPNYHTNVVNAFLTAPLLANFIATLTNTGPVVVAAHSLGNIVTLSAISDWNAPISQYFMVDAAVPIEAIDPTAVTNMMIYSTWVGYSNRLFASDWYQLFPTNDARSTLTWSNRLGNLGAVDVYNFYSSGEEVLRTYTTDPPPDMFDVPIGSVGLQVINHLFAGTPFGTYTWYWQEKGKGPSSQDWFLGSSHGGWKFNPYWEDSFGDPLSPPLVNDITNSTLQSNPMFDFNSTANDFLLSIDSELLGLIYGVNPSDYAQTNRDRILADAIPAMSEVAGANPIPKLAPQNGIDKNIDMMTLENSWSPVRIDGEQNKWHHSDFQQMAYTFTYKLYIQFVTTGNLK